MQSEPGCDFQFFPWENHLGSPKPGFLTHLIAGLGVNEIMHVKQLVGLMVNVSSVVEVKRNHVNTHQTK